VIVIFLTEKEYSWLGTYLIEIILWITGAVA